MKTFEEALSEYATAHKAGDNVEGCWLRKYDAIRVDALSSTPTVDLLVSISVKACLFDAIKDGHGSGMVFDALFWAFMAGLIVGMEMEKTQQ